MTKLISIIMPYHSESHGQIMRAVSTIDSQVGINFEQIEVCLVGDGVAALPEKMFADLLNITPRVVVTPDSQGAGVARQTGIDQTSGKYFIFMDADDVLLDVFVLRDLIADLQSTGDHEMVVAKYTKQARYGEAFSYSDSVRLDWKAAYGKLYNRDYITRIGLRWAPDLRIFEDTYFVGLACQLAKNIQYLDRTVYVWLWNPVSTVRKNHHEFNHQHHIWARSFRHTLDVLKHQRPDLRPQEFYNYMAELYFRERNNSAADPAAYYEEQLHLLDENRDLWTAEGKRHIRQMMAAMTTPGHDHVGESLAGADDYLLRQEAIMYEAFKRSRNRSDSLATGKQE